MLPIVFTEIGYLYLIRDNYFTIPSTDGVTVRKLFPSLYYPALSDSCPFRYS
jgi:hypothetical protein